ncbi:hypothetical protein IB286_09205 [Spongiibacter sp. KMU-158]|uniref:Uncharacterized protein n=1 Tax=Spongiibacter pelagi TaxID=2760804 RepID=A0A927C0V6_9GAMM|nr:hypothetical protein [Spongiibacter pelagi]MBD2859183.1 hypothetical protein [Spongiibacter pelagi]
MTQMVEPDYDCLIEMSEEDFTFLSGVHWKIDILLSGGKHRRGGLTVPQFNSQSENGFYGSWLWLSNPYPLIVPGESVRAKLIEVDGGIPMVEAEKFEALGAKRVFPITIIRKRNGRWDSLSKND